MDKKDQFKKVNLLYPELSYQIIGILIENKIILEIKKADRFLKSNIEQLYAYLKTTGLKLGILANFTKKGLQFKRIINLNS